MSPLVRPLAQADLRDRQWCNSRGSTNHVHTSLHREPLVTIAILHRHIHRIPVSLRPPRQCDWYLRIMQAFRATEPSAPHVRRQIHNLFCHRSIARGHSHNKLQSWLIQHTIVPAELQVHAGLLHPQLQRGHLKLLLNRNPTSRSDHVLCFDSNMVDLSLLCKSVPTQAHALLRSHLRVIHTCCRV